ncbi:ATP-binding protein [Simiduia sp. 21SJ11W-1]|uniref:sensor histidine kinase n=1 Tax=Simiduia sp. 21SJ11W-1 TaxID=2909669 RepID=UPI0020A0AEDE|nr:ATP-binding protein [Simiduia sp. 21SJ11W-1]UTA49316.1 ATP-binding protein [Simiduia sp. 21SJ11W-1]
MIRLFWKVFIGFWLTTILIIVGTALVIHQFDPGGFARPHRAPFFNKDPHAMRVLHYATRDAVNATEQEFLARLQTLPPWALRALFVVNASGKDMLGRTLPPPAEALIRDLNQQRPFMRKDVRGKKYFGRLIQLEDGQIIRMVVASQSEQPNLLLKLFLMNLWPILLISVLVSGTVSYLLGRYLTRPAEVLKAATQRLAAGDFSTRVAPQMRGRKDELSSLALAFDQMAEQLQHAMSAQQRLIKDVSHELRSPLMRLQSALGLALQQSPAATSEHISKAQQAAEYLNNIISDILAIPVNDGEQWPLEDTVDIAMLLTALVEDFQTQAAEKNITLTLSAPAEALVQTRSNTLVGVFENLITNALRHTPNNGKISIALTASGHFWRITLRDTGPGVAPQELEDIFTPFYRTDEARDRNQGGVGLGLSIARRTVTQHGGTISAELAAAGGLIITVQLPSAALPSSN